MKNKKYILILLSVILFFKHRFVKYNQRIFDWHCKNIYPFDKKLSLMELIYIKKCIQYSYWELLRPFYCIFDPIIKRFSYFTYSHRSIKQVINSSRIAYGAVINHHNIYPLALTIFKEKNIVIEIEPSSNINFYGLGWDIVRGHFKVYFRFFDYQFLEPFYKKLLPDESKMKNNYESGLLSITYDRNGNVFERKIYTYPKNTRIVKLKSDQREDTQRDCFHNGKWKRKLDDNGKKLIDIYEKDNYHLDTITYKDQHNYTMYFPKVE